MHIEVDSMQKFIEINVLRKLPIETDSRLTFMIIIGLIYR